MEIPNFNDIIFTFAIFAVVEYNTTCVGTKAICLMSVLYVMYLIEISLILICWKSEKFFGLAVCS